MARKKKSEAETDGSVASVDEFAADLIKVLNKESGSRVAYNLATDLSPTHIKRWLSTGCRGLDYIISNRRDGGLPEGRIIEIHGPPSIGKSHLATQIARETQQCNGIAVYMDTENATQIENLEALGVDISKRFVFCEPGTIEECFQVAERTIKNAQKMAGDVPVTIILDSVAAAPPKAELDADYDKDLIGVKARAISKGMRKITQLIGDKDVTFILLNQTRVAIGQMFGDPMTVPGGKAIPFHASVRLRIHGGQPIKDADGRVIGIHVWVKTIKNKVAYPFRRFDFRIIFGVGIFEHEELFDVVRQHCAKLADKQAKLKENKGRKAKELGYVRHGGKDLRISGTGAWKVFEVVDPTTGEVLIEKKFPKSKFNKVMEDPQYKEYIDVLLDEAFIIKKNEQHEPDIDEESYEEVKAVGDLLDEHLVGAKELSA